MRRYAELGRAGNGPENLAERIELLERHDAAVTEQIALLRAQRQHLHEKIAYYRRELGEQ